MNKKKVFGEILKFVGLAISTAVIVFVTFYGTILGLFIIPYLGYCALALGIGVVVSMWVLTYLKQKRKTVWKISWVYFGVILLIGGGFGLADFIESRIPAVGDGSLILSEYIPFDKETKLVSLNEESTLKLEGDLPKVDGATALFPVYSAFVQATYPKQDYLIFKDESWRLDLNDEQVKASDKASQNNDIWFFRCTKTNDAYVRLINGEADIIFVAGPSDEQLKAAEDLGVKMKFTPIGKEAFVFFVNSKNKVEDLTVEEIQKIYSGQITNWSEVGGDNGKIKAFQRPKNSGSQTTLEKLMDGKDLIKPIEDEVVDGMGGIIDKTADYKNYKNAIGYSFRYFSTDMVKNDEIKHLALNGVKPTKETIRDGSYPISNNFYAVTLEENQNPNVDKFIEWILSEQGQHIIEETGYVGIGE